MKSIVGLALAAALLAPAGRVQAGAPTPLGLAAGLLDPSAEARASAAKAIGAADLFDAAPSIPVLVEALDDEAPGVAKAAEDAIVALANRAAPALWKAISEGPTADFDEGMVDIVQMLGAAFTPADVANGLLRGAPPDRRVAWIAAALVGGGVDSEWSSKGTLRMASLEVASPAGVEKELAAAAEAFIAYRIVSDRAWARGTDVAPLSMAGGLPSIATVIADTKQDKRSAFAARFVAATGIGDKSTVAALKSRVAPPPAPRSIEVPPGAIGPDGMPKPGWLPDPPVQSDASLRSIAALGRLSHAVPEASAALDAVPAKDLDFAVAVVATSGGAPYVARRALSEKGELRAQWAQDAASAGARDVGLVPIIVERAVPVPPRDERDAPAALEALGRMGPVAFLAIEPLDTRLRKKHSERNVRVPVSAALLRIRPGHEMAQEALLEDATSAPGELAGMALSGWFRDRNVAIRGLAAGGAGPAAAAVLAKSLAPFVGDVVPPDELDELSRMEAVAMGLGRLAADAGSDGARALAGLIEMKLPGDGTDETAAGMLEAQYRASTPFRLRAAALRSIGEYGNSQAGYRDRIQRFRDSPDPRIRYLAAQTIRRITVATPDK